MFQALLHSLNSILAHLIFTLLWRKLRLRDAKELAQFQLTSEKEEF